MHKVVLSSDSFPGARSGYDRVTGRLDAVFYPHRQREKPATVFAFRYTKTFYL